jgi:hypothetical protein
LHPRHQKKQFEIFSADFMADRTGKPWLIEFNFGCVLFDPLAGQQLTTKGLREYQRLHEELGDKAEINDQTMIQTALQLALFPKEVKETLWEETGWFTGPTSGT